MSKTLVLKPRLSEQTYALAGSQHVYAFDVPKDANKHAVARAVASQFGVKVAAVNIANIPGKAKRTISISGKRRAADGARSNVKKAYVRLADGMSLPVFAAVEAAQEKEQATQEKVDKAVAKQTKKTDKKTGTAAAHRGLHLFKKEGEK